MLTRTYLGFATHKKCTHMQAQKTYTHSCTQVFKSRVAGHFKIPLRVRNKSRATEQPNLHYADFSQSHKSSLRGFLSPALMRILKTRFANQLLISSLLRVSNSTLRVFKNVSKTRFAGLQISRYCASQAPLCWFP